MLDICLAVRACVVTVYVLAMCLRQERIMRGCRVNRWIRQKIYLAGVWFGKIERIVIKWWVEDYKELGITVKYLTPQQGE